MDKEKIKEFLKPDWGKVLITLGIFPTVILLGTISVLLGKPFSIFFNLYHYIVFGPGYLKGDILGIETSDPGSILELLDNLSLVLWWYFLSCLIVFILAYWTKYRVKKQ